MKRIYDHAKVGSADYPNKIDMCGSTTTAGVPVEEGEKVRVIVTHLP